MSVVLVGEQIPSVPVDFQRRLAAFDKDLYVVWHKSPYSKQPGRWKIERCIRHFGGKEHSHVCERVYILMCEDADGTPKPLGEWVLDELRAGRQRWEALGGDTERGVRNALAESNRVEQELQAKREAASEDMIKYNQKDKRFQFNKLIDLIARHDMRPNK